MRFVRRAALLAVVVAVMLGASTAPSRAAIDMAVGPRQVVKSGTVAECNTKAKSALNAVLQDAAEIGTGDTGEWLAYGPADASGHSSSGAAVHCYPLDNGYFVTFTCAVQVAPNTDTASALCSKLAAAFAARAAAFTAPAYARDRLWR
jgi:hypothetical protein